MSDRAQRDMGKTYIQLMGFIKAVKQGKSAIIFAPEYVVMDRASYDRLNRENRELRKKFQALDDYIEGCLV